jgi:hypothetical protein
MLAIGVKATAPTGAQTVFSASSKDRAWAKIEKIAYNYASDFRATHGLRNG